ncbi:MAG: putative toxin-antitoxin system toxin component, PIN family [Selenomonadaceae bacterium]|nr:putative toxin-antitoxin system toxin component, PIN family [Selenomonadaceae bacterium]MBO6305059.1 putative toxin-antitoxin system toxin component, PIN family [Selenomonadaceae bacterium]
MMMNLLDILKKFAKKGMQKNKWVMIDTNILFSSCFYSSETTVRLFEMLHKNNFEIVITKDVIEEFFDVTNRKNSNKLFLVQPFLDDLKYTLIPSAEDYTDVPNIRDEKDRPILAAAIKSDVDYLITGDKDFLVLKDIVKKPKIFTMQEFIEKFS